MAAVVSAPAVVAALGDGRFRAPAVDVVHPDRTSASAVLAHSVHGVGPRPVREQTLTESDDIVQVHP